MIEKALVTWRQRGPYGQKVPPVQDSPLKIFEINSTTKIRDLEVGEGRGGMFVVRYFSHSSKKSFLDLMNSQQNKSKKNLTSAGLNQKANNPCPGGGGGRGAFLQFLFSRNQYPGTRNFRFWLTTTATWKPIEKHENSIWFHKIYWISFHIKIFFIYRISTGPQIRGQIAWEVRNI